MRSITWLALSQHQVNLLGIIRIKPTMLNRVMLSIKLSLAMSINYGILRVEETALYSVIMAGGLIIRTPGWFDTEYHAKLHGWIHTEYEAL